MKYLSLFTGIGGFELGIKQAYEENRIQWNRSSRPKHRGGSQNLQSKGKVSTIKNTPIACIGYSEIDKYAVQIYEKHFKHKNYGDITKINVQKLPDFDLIVGGFPCQSFSIAGKRGGFKDTRGTLFFEVARIIKAKRPRYILLENVKGLLSHDEGNTFATIISTIDELGYDCQWQVLNSKNFGVPQNRERVFIIGHLRGTPRPKVFPFEKTIEEIDELQKQEQVRLYNPYDDNYSDISRTLNVGCGSPTTKNGQLVIKKPNFNRFPIKENGKEISRTLLARDYKDPKLVRDVKRIGGLYDKGKETHQAGSIYDISGISGTLDTGQGGNRQPFIQSNSHGFNKGGKRKIPNVRESAIENEFVNGIRKLTPVECERLQGFPDNWTEGVSDTQRYKTLGNAVTVNVIKEVVKRLISNL